MSILNSWSGVTVAWRSRNSVVVKLMFSSVCLGMLCAFMVWSLWWAIDARGETTYDMSGPVSVISLQNRAPSTGNEAAVRSSLLVFLSNRSLSVIVSPSEGFPGLGVYDSQSRIPWLPSQARAGDEVTTSEHPSGKAYLFQEGYSADLWARTTTTPLLPGGVLVDGVIAPPKGADDLQYAFTLGSLPLSSGDYVISTTNAEDVSQMVEILRPLGFVPENGRDMSLPEYLRRQPLVSAIAVMVGLGYSCFVLFWSMHLFGRGKEFGVRSRHGASVLTLARQIFARGVIALVLGISAGVTAAVLAAVTVGKAVIDQGQFLALGVGAGLGVVMTALVWLATLLIVIRSRYQVNLVS